MTEATKEELLQTKLEFLQEISKSKVEANNAAEKRRNEALGIFAAFALLLSILAYFGLEQTVKAKIDALGGAQVLQAASTAASQAEAQRDRATQSANSIATLLAQQRVGGVRECRVCFQEVEGADNQCGGTRDSCSGWSGAPTWTSAFRDDTDSRSGGCTYQWKLECR